MERPDGDLPHHVASRRKTGRPVPQRFQWFDQWKVAKGQALKSLVAATIQFIDHHERHLGTRKRARRPGDQRHHTQRIETIVCNLAHAVLLPPPLGRISVPLAHGAAGRARYDSPVTGKLFSPVLSLLWNLDFLDLSRPSVSRGEVSSIAPSDWFARKVREAGVQLSDFGRHEAEEVIILSRNKRGTGSDGEREVSRETIDYPDNALTRRYRADLRTLNDYLESADIEFLNDGVEPRIDPFNRTLRRRFVFLPKQKVRFDQGGRLYGGFWQNLKANRRGSIRINGEPTSVLDYSSMFTRLAYAEIGEAAPGGDLYAIPGLEHFRSGAKLAMNCFLFDGGMRRSWPSSLGVGVGDDDDAKSDPGGEAAKYEARLPEGWTVSRTRNAVLQVHPALKPAWGKRLGYRLMFKESEIMMDALADLASQDIPALCLHDGLIVARSAQSLAKRAMARIAHRATGFVIPVAEKA